LRKTIHLSAFLLALLAGYILISPAFSAEALSPREKLSLDKGWSFALGHPYDPVKDFGHGTGYFSYITKTGYGDGPADHEFDDRGWRKVDVPHDWAMELPFDAKGSRSHGYKAMGRNFPEASVGWYRRHFYIPESDLGRRISVVFDGVHRDAIVWVNGFYLGRETSGYSPFRYDVSDYLNYGGDNVVAVRADVTLEEGWFYEAAGIYRHTWLEKTQPLHLAPGGVFVTSEVKGKDAELTVLSTVMNDGRKTASFEVLHEVLDEKGRPLVSTRGAGPSVKPGSRGETRSQLKLPNARLWSLESPNLYKMVTTVRSGSTLLDRVETPFGIRTLRFDPDQGFFLNGKHVKIKGTCNHQDHAGVGAALPDALQEFRIRALKSFGSNAYRCAHNPPTPELLDACDRLGMLVMVENRLMGTTQELLDRLERIVLRDRNHPSVFAWSLGNEEWDIEGNIKGERITDTLQEFLRRLDPTRGITAASSGGWGHGISKVIDVMGYNYKNHGNMDEHHAKFPKQPSMGTEETSTHSTRGVHARNDPKAHLAPTDRTGGASSEKSWKYYLERPFVAGLFYWTGFDYRGEPTPFDWPAVSSQYGILDLCGFPKDPYHYLKAWWSDQEVLHLEPHWNWKGLEGKPVTVRAYANCEEVELFLNDKSQGRQSMPKDSHLDWTVPYRPGVLSAKGWRSGKEVSSFRVETTGPAVALELVPDRVDLKADGEDVAVVTVRALDSQGRPVPVAGNEVTFTLEGSGRLLGTDNGDPSCHEPNQVFDEVSSSYIKDLKFKKVDSWEKRPEVAPGFSVTGWPEGFSFRGRIDGKVRNNPMTMVIRGEFFLEAYRPDTKITLFSKSIGDLQDLYINGHLVAKGLTLGSKEQAYPLDHKILRPGKNVYAMVGIPIKMRWDWDYGNTDPGYVGMVTPHGDLKHSLFSGLAQVLVQSGTQAEDLVLKASAKGLAPAILRLEARAASQRPSAPVAPQE